MGLANWTYKAVKRLLILIIGSTVVLIGIVMIFTPGPASLVIPIGLAILATEFVWARKLLRQFKKKAASMAHSAQHFLKKNI